jgi:hypothetical protein
LTVKEGQKSKSFPLNNLNTEVPKPVDIPKNNYDDRGYKNGYENAKLEFNKQKIQEEVRSRNPSPIKPTFPSKLTAVDGTQTERTQTPLQVLGTSDILKANVGFRTFRDGCGEISEERVKKIIQSSNF